jgi:HK97 family phage portal protein
MNIKNRLKLAVKTFQGDSLSSSFGAVIRNYGKKVEFRPNEQLRGITYKAIDKVGLSLSVYQPIVLRKDNKEYINHPLYNLFNNPNSKLNASDFIHLYGMLFEIYGETFWYLVRGENTRKIKEIYLLNPLNMRLEVEDGELLGYTLIKDNGEHIPLEVDEVIHDKRPNPFNPWRGMSVMERASTYIDTEIVTSTFTLNYMRNNASPSGIVTLPKMSRENFKQFTQQWRENYEGPENAGKTAFIRDAEANFKAVGATLKDVDQEITRKMAKNDVLMMLEVPKELLGLSDGGALGRNAIEAITYVYSKEKIEPIMRRLDRIYQTIVKDSFTSSGEVKVTHTSPIQEDKEHKLSMYDKGVGRWITPNEIRAEMGLEARTDGNTLTVVSQTTVPSTPNKAKKVVLKKISKSEKMKKLNQEQEEFRKNIVENSDLYTSKLKSTLTRFFNEQENQVVGKIETKSKAFEEWLFEIKEESEELALLLVPIILELMEVQAEDVANFITGELLTISPEMKKTVEANILKLAGEINQDTITKLQGTLTEGQSKGESLIKLKKRVEEVYGDAKGYRAERIARTESLKTSNETAELVYKENGFTEVRWFINPGACQFCKIYADRVKSIGSAFTKVGDVVTAESGDQMRIEYRDIQTPPLHPNCTCSLVPER